jgi:hypothetical protein
VDVSALRDAIEPPRAELGREDRVLVVAGVTGPLAWFAQLAIGFAIVGDLCAAQASWPFHLLTAVAFALAVASAVVCWMRRRPVPDGAEPEASPRRALAWAGVALGAFSAVVIAGLEVPALVLHPCL